MSSLFCFTYSSIDNFIYVWDTNDPRTPVITLSAVTGASQVIKYSSTNDKTFNFKVPLLGLLGAHIWEVSCYST